MKAIFLILIVSLNSFGQSCKNEKWVFKYIESSLEMDINYFLEIEKNQIPKARIYYSSEKINMNLKRFNYSVNKNDISNNMTWDDTVFKSFGVSKNRCNYLLFSSSIEGNKIMIELFFKRDSNYNIQNGSEYESWRRNNAGMSYLFVFDKLGNIMEIFKEGISYD